MGLLDAVLADAEIGQLQQRVAGLLCLRDRSNIPDDVRRAWAQGVRSGEALLDRHARQLGYGYFNPRHVLPAEIGTNHDRHEGMLAANVTQHPAAIRLADFD